MTTVMCPSIGLLSEFAYVISTRAGYSDLLGALVASADRLVDPSVPSGARRDCLSRLALSIFIASFILAAAMALVLPVLTGPAGILGAISATLALCWMAALSVSSVRAQPYAGIAMLFAAAACLGALVAASGGGSSPLALLVFGLIAEPVWVRRTHNAGWIGLAAATGAVAVAMTAPLSAAAEMWHWVPTLAYLGSLGLRLAAIRPQLAEQASDTMPYAGEGAIALRFNADGEVGDVAASAPAGFEIGTDLLFGTGLADRVHVADRVAYLSAIADMRAGKGEGSIELRLRLPISADEQATSPRYGLFELSLGEGRFAVLRQIDEIADLRERLAAAEREAASIAATKGRLLASVSHELRTPLNAIIGFSDMLLLELCGPLKDERQREHVTLVRDAGNHLLGVVNAILDVSRIESGAHALTPEPFRFSEAVELCRSMIVAQANAKQIAVNMDIGREVGELTADRRSVQQILINLVSNAVKFTRPGGEVTIAAERLGSRLVFSVEDNGIGIEAADLAKLGQPFTQVRNDYTRQYDGLGLGLSLVKGLVALHGGSMQIESAPGEGTKVEVSLPINGSVAAGEARLVMLADKRPRESGDGKLLKTA